jgi:hypothetical protein
MAAFDLPRCSAVSVRSAQTSAFSGVDDITRLQMISAAEMSPAAKARRASSIAAGESVMSRISVNGLSKQKAGQFARPSVPYPVLISFGLA